MDRTSNLKEALDDVLGLVIDCPEELRGRAFQILLQHRLSSQQPSERGGSGDIPPDATLYTPAGGDLGRGADLQLSDLHVKARRLIAVSGMTLDDLNQLFYKENGEIKSLYDDLGSSQMAESQVRLALLEALENAIVDGDFKFDSESVRAKCRTFKCYDSPNFLRNFRNNETLFDGFEKGVPVKLSAEGRRRLGEVVAELARRP